LCVARAVKEPYPHAKEWSGEELNELKV